MPDTVLQTKYPPAIDTGTSLGEPLNDRGSSLLTDISSLDTILPMDTTALPASGVMEHSGELVTYNDKTSSQIGTVANPAVRGAYGTTPQVHAAGSIFDLVITAQHHIALRSAIVAIETKLGAGSSAPASAGQFIIATAAGSSAWGSLASVHVTAALGYVPLNPANNLSETDATTARVNLGLGAAATRPVGTGVGDVVEVQGDGKILSSLLPALAITDTSVVASQAAMLALAAEVGDVAVRSDLNKSFILRVAPAAVLANWQELLTPTDAVLSVFGRTGAVSAAMNDYTWAQVNKTVSSLSDVTTKVLPYLSFTSADATLARKDIEFWPGAHDICVTAYRDQTSTEYGNYAARKGYFGSTPGANPQGGHYLTDLRVTTNWAGNPNDADKWIGLYIFNQFNALTASTVTTQDMFGINVENMVYDPTGTAWNVWTIYGGHFVASHDAPGQVLDAQIGLMGKSRVFNSGLVNKHRGVQGWAETVAGSTANTTASRGVYGVITHNGSGTMTSASAGYFELNINAGVMTTASGVRIGNQALGGSGTNKYGLYIEQQTVFTPGNWTNVWNIYSAGDVPNVFEGVIKSTKASGAKPIDVTSTTLCTNLNADMVDGFNASDLAPITSPTILVSAAISGTAPSLTFTDTTASAKSLIVVVDANVAQLREVSGVSGSLLAVDLTNNRLGLGIAAPNRQFHVHEATAPVMQFTNSTTGSAAGDGFQFQQFGLDTYFINQEAGLMIFRTSDTDRLTISAAGRIRLHTSVTPASAAAAGLAGEVCWDASFIYVCIAANTWKRVAISTW